MQGFTKDFPDLRTLITHHSVMQELLPVTLLLTRHNPAFEEGEQKEEENLADFRSMNITNEVAP